MSHAQKDTDHTMNNGRKKKIRKECDRKKYTSVMPPTCCPQGLSTAPTERGWRGLALLFSRLFLSPLVTLIPAFPSYVIWNLVLDKHKPPIINTYSQFFFFGGDSVCYLLEMSEFRWIPSSDQFSMCGRMRCDGES